MRGGEAKTATTPPTRAWLLAVIAALAAAGAQARAAEPSPEPVAAEEDEPAPSVGGSDAALDAGPAPEFVDPVFGPRYVIEDVVVRGNRKTKTPLIVDELGLKVGDTVGASDPRVEAARYRLLALGHFLDARLSVQRGSRRGAVLLLVEVEERGTIVINELYPSTSAATLFWGGADVSETNFLGRGINLGAGFLMSTKPVVRGSEQGLGLRLHTSIPERRGPFGLALSETVLYNDGSEFYRQSGEDSDPDPGRFTAAGVRRVGGIIGVGRSFGRAFHGSVDLRGESVQATLPVLQTRVLPDGGTEPIDFDVLPGHSRLSTIALTLDYDTRSDPILPRSGARVVASLEAGGPALGGQYTFAKMVLQGSLYFKMPRGHALGLHLMGGAIAGDAPYFDQFYVGDLNVLLPRRAMGMSFSTQPSWNLLGTSIAGHRYDDYAARALVEYAIPVWRRRGFVYGSDAFAAFGIFGMASDGDLDPPGGLTWSALPVDLTADVGFRLDTYVGIFTISIANALSRSSF